MKIEVPHFKSSEDYIKDIFSRYVEVDKLPTEIEGRCVIHMYPYEDTGDGKTGFVDSYNCELHIYNCDNNTVYKTKNHDEVNISKDCGVSVRIFKDLSTMIILDGICILSGQSLSIYKLYK